MNYISVEPEERTRRNKETREIIKRNIKFLRQCGFKPDPESSRKWFIPALNSVDVCEHEFHSIESVVEAVRLKAYQEGQLEVRNQIKRALGIFL